MKRKVLGKGLAALLPGPAAADEGEKLLELPPDRIDPNPEQPRQHIDPERLSELAKSMVEQGVIEPLVVRRMGARADDRCREFSGARSSSRWVA